VLDEPAIVDLEQALATLEQPGDVRGVIVRSGKSGSFVAGADVRAIASITERPRVREIVRRAHTAFERLARLPVPTVAAIDGVCLGGGTELALACDSRVCSEEPSTQIGLPEVLLGILPGFGGSTRLPRLIGLSNALDLILTGRALDARRAQRLGLVAHAVPSAWLIEWAERRVDELLRRPARARRDVFRPKDFMSWALDGNPFGRAQVLQRARAMTQARMQGTTRRRSRRSP
jgi:3-hydroxyacyl-CoA dehydrogenase/enoyl-CoA hydratase/3-hydroxybutyryl-CoA epimerase